MEAQPRILAPSTPASASRHVTHTRPSLAARTQQGVEQMRRHAAQSTRSPLLAHSVHGSTQASLAQASQPGRSSFADRMGASSSRTTRSHDGDQRADERQGSSSTRRDERLRVVETLERGPRDSGTAPLDHSQWETFEPNSRTRLKQRRVSNEHLCSWMESRYCLAPSTLYSIVDPKPTNLHGDYEVPLVGEWLTIAAIVEMSPIKVSQGKQYKAKPGKNVGEIYVHPDSDASSHDEADQHLDDQERKRRSYERRKSRHEQWLAAKKLTSEQVHPNEREIQKEHAKGRRQQGLPVQQQKQSVMDMDKHGDESEGEAERKVSAGRKYMLLRLQDLGADAKGGGDDMLTLIVFQALKEDRLPNQRSSWRGGSGGAFERLIHERPGALLCITNPRVSDSAGLLVPTKPGGKSTAASKVFKLKLVHDSTLTVIGQVADFSRCQAMTKEGNLCSAYVDGRSGSKVCETHFEASLKHRGGKRHDLVNASTDWQHAAYTSDLKLNPNFGTSAFVRDPVGETLFEPRSSASGRTAGKRVHRGPAVFGEGALLAASDPNSQSFDPAAYYGRGKADKEARRKKASEEAAIIRRLEARRGHSGAPKSHQTVDPLRQEFELPDSNSGTSQAGDLPLQGSVAARALLCAQRTLERRREAVPASTQKRGRSAEEISSRASKSRKAGSGKASAHSRDCRLSSAQAPSTSSRCVYGPEMIKRIGFDPLAGRRAQQTATGSGSSLADNRARLLALHKRSEEIAAPVAALPPRAMELGATARVDAWRDTTAPFRHTKASARDSDFRNSAVQPCGQDLEDFDTDLEIV